MKKEKEEMREIDELIYKMITQNTGTSLGDSGGSPKYDKQGNYTGSTDGYGRHYEAHKGKSIDDFKKEPEVIFDYDTGELEINTFHYLVKQLELDDLCREFNSIPCRNREGSILGTSKEQSNWLEYNNISIDSTYNTYNRESFLSQVLQYLEVSNTYDDFYLLIQTHNGCDVRGGYSDIKMFRGSYLLPERVKGKIIFKNYSIPVLNKEESAQFFIYGDVILHDKGDDLFNLKPNLKNVRRKFPIHSKIDLKEYKNIELSLIF